MDAEQVRKALKASDNAEALAEQWFVISADPETMRSLAADLDDRDTGADTWTSDAEKAGRTELEGQALAYIATAFLTFLGHKTTTPGIDTRGQGFQVAGPGYGSLTQELCDRAILAACSDPCIGPWGEHDDIDRMERLTAQSGLTLDQLDERARADNPGTGHGTVRTRYNEAVCQQIRDLLGEGE